MIKTAAQYWASHSAHGHSPAGHDGPWLAQRLIQQGDAPTDSSPATRAWCAELLEHRRRVAYPPSKAMTRGALWGGGSSRGGRNLPAAVAFVEKSDKEVD
jgi:hypothetical protein